jgi:hypothetical protein
MEVNGDGDGLRYVVMVGWWMMVDDGVTVRLRERSKPSPILGRRWAPPSPLGNASFRLESLPANVLHRSQQAWTQA